MIQGADFNGYQKDAVAAPDMETLAETVDVLDAITSTPAGQELLVGAQQANGITESNTFVDLGVTQADMVADGAHTPDAETFTVEVGSQSHSFVSSTEFLPVEVQGPGGTTRPGEATFGERVGHEELHNANPDASEGQVQEMMDRLMPSGRRIRH